MDNWVRIEDDGKLVMDDPAGVFNLNSPFLRLLEDMPVIGYYVALLDVIEGDTDEALRAAAVCTYSTFVMAAAFAAAAFTGPVGVAVAASIAGFAGTMARSAIGSFIGDPDMRNEVTAITIYRVLTQELFIIAGAGLGAASGAFSELMAEEMVELGFGGFFVDASEWLLKKGGSELTKEEFKKLVEILVEALKDDTKGENWIKQQFGDYDSQDADILNAPFGIPGKIQPRGYRNDDDEDEDRDAKKSDPFLNPDSDDENLWNEHPRKKKHPFDFGDKVDLAKNTSLITSTTSPTLG
ncbi:hypothetical protein EMCG_02499 [[Emmonsia] crescens]|uniref:Uncharacterized protein n=1 Tax=[Emmonsia] crescens TaxID=73230 RepID=A0A0G2HXU4_9EURO|nr:hypothetical protein EMCG_02499 [Emmonsia crescens UAMH 3008]